MTSKVYAIVCKHVWATVDLILDPGTPTGTSSKARHVLECVTTLNNRYTVSRKARQRAKSYKFAQTRHLQQNEQHQDCMSSQDCVCMRHIQHGSFRLSLIALLESPSLFTAHWTAPSVLMP
jgi:hypothetical protein